MTAIETVSLDEQIETLQRCIVSPGTYVPESQFRAILAALRELRQMRGEGWISVSERLPPECTKVLAIFDDSYGGFSLVATREGDKWFDETICNGLREISDVVLWRPIPDWTLPTSGAPAALSNEKREESV